MINEWKPNWTDHDIRTSLKAVGERVILNKYKYYYTDAKERCKNQNYSPIITRADCGKVKRYEGEIVEKYMEDAERVLRVIRDKWDKYSQIVLSQHGAVEYENILSLTKKGPANIYSYLVSEHIHKPWHTHHAGFEASNFTAWSKLCRDNKFLWNPSQFERIR